MKNSKDYFRGCLLGGAVGDALGYAVEFMSMEDIIAKYGPAGIRELEIDGSTGTALISDDTQMTAYTADGLLWADNRARAKGVYAYTQSIFYAYQVWLFSQTGRFADEKYKERTKACRLYAWPDLAKRRVPSPTCIKTLGQSIKGKYGTIKNRINNSKGNGGVKRAAPVGLYFYDDPRKAFQFGCESAAITYGNSDGFLPAGFFACMTAYLIQGERIERAIECAMRELGEWTDCNNTMNLIEKAVSLSKRKGLPYDGIVQLGEGRTGEEALAMGIFASLTNPNDYKEAVCVAVNHGGDSDCIGSICGNIMGATLGSLEIPYNWIHKMELDDMLVCLADSLEKATKERI